MSFSKRTIAKLVALLAATALIAAACGSDDGDRVDMRQVIGGQDGCTVARDAFCAVDSPSQERSQEGGEKHPQCTVHGCGGEGLRTGLNDPVRLEGIPCRFKFASFVHNRHFRVEALMFIHQGEAMRPVFAGQG